MDHRGGELKDQIPQLFSGQVGRPKRRRNRDFCAAAAASPDLQEAGVLDLGRNNMPKAGSGPEPGFSKPHLHLPTLSIKCDLLSFPQPSSHRIRSKYYSLKLLVNSISDAPTGALSHWWQIHNANVSAGNHELRSLPAPNPSWFFPHRGADPTTS